MIAARLVRILHKKISTKATHDADTQIHETNGNITNLHYAIMHFLNELDIMVSEHQWTHFNDIKQKILLFPHFILGGEGDLRLRKIFVFGAYVSTLLKTIVYRPFPFIHLLLEG